ncbi:MAG TPA: ATP-binding protein [Candidatus Binatia bacterium]
MRKSKIMPGWEFLQNLIGNATKYCGARAPEIHVGYKREGAMRRFSVKDCGIVFRTIFEISRRLHTKQKHSGTGIGLGVCKKMVERHGGRMWVETRRDKDRPFISRCRIEQ